MEIAARPDEHLAQLARIQTALDNDTFTHEGAKEIAKRVLRPKTIQRLRLSAIAGMVSSGYMDDEIFLQLADPASQYHVLLRHMNQKITQRIKGEINAIRVAREAMGEAAYKEDYLRSRQRLLEDVWGAIQRADAARIGRLIEIADALTVDIAENQGVVQKRAGRKRSKKDIEEGGAEDLLRDTSPEDPKVDWREEFVPDDGSEGNSANTAEDREPEKSTDSV